jgi:GTPase Era involved in 16S rRNA processing
MTKQKSLYNIKMSASIGSDPYGLGGAYSVNAVSYKEHMIQGKMFVHHMEISEYQMQTMHDDDIKETLVRELVHQLATSNYIEFTKIQNMQYMNWHCRARIFVTPNDQVRILREAGY